MNKYAVGVLSYHHNITGQGPRNFYSPSETERIQTGKDLLVQIFNDFENKDKVSGLFRMFEDYGFVVCDQGRNDAEQHTIEDKHTAAK